MSFGSVILEDLKIIVQRIEQDLTNALNFLKSYIEEAFTEEQAALFPEIEAQAVQLLQDVIKTQGLTVKERVAMAVTELTSDLSLDAALTAQTLYNAYVWTVAHKLGLIDGNQGTLPGGTQIGG